MTFCSLLRTLRQAHKVEILRTSLSDALKMTISGPERASRAFATVSCNVFLQAGYSHGHLVRQGSFLGARELTQAK